MTKNNQAQITKDVANKKVIVTRSFEATVEQVWKAWTESQLLDKWWAPKPWKAETKTMDFKEGGRWLYCMVGPNGERHWAAVDYKTIVLQKSFTAIDTFCDEEGNKNNDLPSMNWKNEFKKTSSGVIVEVEITFPSEDALKNLMEMGFEEGFTMALGNLEALLAK